MRVIVTRPAAQGRAWAERLRGLGVDVLELPLIGIEPAVDPAAVEQAWSRVRGAALVMFVSANAVEHFFAARPSGQGWPDATAAGSTGPGTSAALRAAGLAPQRIVEPGADGPFDTESLWRLLRHWNWSGRTALVVRGEGGRDWLAEQLRAAGAEVEFVAAYRRVAPDFDPAQAALVRSALADPAAYAWHFSSSEAIDNLLRAWPGGDWSRALALATHSRIAETAQHRGFGRVVAIGVRPQDVAAALTRLEAPRATPGPSAAGR